MDDNDFSDLEEKQVYQSEFKAFERASAGKLGTKSIRDIHDPKERFQAQIDAISRSLADITDSTDSISEQDILDMGDMTSRVNKIEYKNPTCYVLGYIASTKGTKITQKSVDHVFDKILPYIKDKSVKQEDVLRYARLWLNLVKST